MGSFHLSNREMRDDRPVGRDAVPAQRLQNLAVRELGIFRRERVDGWGDNALIYSEIMSDVFR